MMSRAMPPLKQSNKYQREHLKSAVEHSIQQDTDMFIISKDLQSVPCHRALLALFSPLVARLLGPVPCCVAPSIFLPDFPAHIIRKFLHILKSGQAVPSKISNVDIKFLQKIGDALSVDLSDLSTEKYVNNPLGSVKEQEKINIQQDRFFIRDSVGEGDLNDNEEEIEYIEQEVDASNHESTTDNDITEIQSEESPVIDCDRDKIKKCDILSKQKMLHFNENKENEISPKYKLESLSHKNMTKVHEVSETPTKLNNLSISLPRDEIDELLDSYDDIDNIQTRIQKDFGKNGDPNNLTNNLDGETREGKRKGSGEVRNINKTTENNEIQEVYETPKKSNTLSMSLARDKVYELLNDNDDMDNFQNDLRKNVDPKSTNYMMNNLDGSKSKFNVYKNIIAIEDTDTVSVPKAETKGESLANELTDCDREIIKKEIDKIMRRDILSNIQKMLGEGDLNDNEEEIEYIELEVDASNHESTTDNDITEIQSEESPVVDELIDCDRDKIKKCDMLSKQKMLHFNENRENVISPKDKLESILHENTTKNQEVYVTPTKSDNLSISLPRDEIDELLDGSDDIDSLQTEVQNDSRKNAKQKAINNLIKSIDGGISGGKRQRDKSVKNVSKNTKVNENTDKNYPEFYIVKSINSTLSLPKDETKDCERDKIKRCDILSNLKKMLNFNGNMENVLSPMVKLESLSHKNMTKVQEVDETPNKSNNSTVSLPRDEIDELLDDNDDMDNSQTEVQKYSRKNAHSKTTNKSKHNFVKNVSKSTKVNDVTDKNYPELLVDETSTISNNLTVSRDEIYELLDGNDDMDNFHAGLQNNFKKNGDSNDENSGGKRKRNKSVNNVAKNKKVHTDANDTELPNIDVGTKNPIRKRDKFVTHAKRMKLNEDTGKNDPVDYTENGSEETTQDDDPQEGVGKIILTMDAEYKETVRDIFHNFSKTKNNGSKTAWTCTECSRDFSSKKLVDSHIDYKHTENILHKCSECGLLHNTNDSLTRHFGKVHKKKKNKE